MAGHKQNSIITAQFMIDVIVEIPKNSHIKYEYDSKLKRLKCDRVLHTPFNYFLITGMFQIH